MSDTATGSVITFPRLPGFYRREESTDYNQVWWLGLRKQNHQIVVVGSLFNVNTGEYGPVMPIGRTTGWVPLTLADDCEEL